MGYPKLREQVTIGGVAFNLRMMVILWLTVIVTMVDAYHAYFLGAWLRPFGLSRYGFGAIGVGQGQFVLFFAVPVLAVLLMGDSPRDYGLRLGNWKEGLIWLAVVCPLILVMLWITVKPGSELALWYHQRYYGALPRGTSPVVKQLRMLYSTGILLVGWEYLLRGFLLFGLARILGPGPAIFIQMVPFALLHAGKAELEAMSTWASGVGFGFVAWRTQSCFYKFIIHWFMLVAVILIAVWVSGT